MKYILCSSFLAIFLINYVECVISRDTTTVTLKPEYFRLFNTSNVESYSIKLYIDKGLRTFNGSNVINLKTNVETNEFRFNYDKLLGLDDYDNYILEEKKGKTHYIEKIILCENCQTVTLYTKDKVPASTKVKLTINGFIGNLSTKDLNGLYLTKTKDNTTVIAASFNPIYARRVIPCFDEPSFKAKVTLEVTFPTELGSCAFNTRVVKTSEKHGYVTFKFGKTEALPMHLLNLVLTDYQSVTKQLGKKTIMIYTPAYNICYTKFAATAAINIIQKLEGLLGLTLDLQQLVLYTLPDINAKVQSAWGLITYPQEDCLYNDKENSVLHQQRIVTAMAESFIRMWFNVLLPIEWWTNVWLSESLIKFISRLAIKGVHPDWNIPSLTFDIEQNLMVDGNANTKPLELPESMVAEPQQILDQFDENKINKGLGIITMIGNILGSNETKNWMTKFIKENKDNTLTPDLIFNFFDKQKTPGLTGPASLPDKISVILNDWIKTSGVPVLNLKRDGNDVTIQQNKLVFPETYQKKTEPERWYIPISFTQLSNPDFEDDTPKLWVTPDTDVRLTNILKDKEDGIILNNQASGLYTINYDKPLLNNIKNVLRDKPDLIDETTKSLIILNIITMSMAGVASFDSVLDVVDIIDKDSSPETWAVTLENIGNSIDIIGEDTPTAHKILDSLADKLNGFIDSLNFTNIGENPETTKVQTVAIEWGVKINNSEVLNIVKDEFEKLLARKEVPRDIISVVTSTALKENPQNFFPVLQLLKDKQDDGKFMLDIINSLGSTPDKTQLLYFLGQIVDPKSFIKPQYRLDVINSVLNGSPTGPDALLEFLLFTIRDIIAVGIDVVNDIIMPLSEKIVTPEQVCQLNAIVCCDCNALIVVTPEQNEIIWKTISGNHLRSVNIRMQADDFFA